MSMVSVLTTVNAPYSKQLNGAMLAACLKNPTYAKAAPGHMSSFFGEVPLTAQLDFAQAFDISADQLVAAAKAFADFSGEKYLLAA